MNAVRVWGQIIFFVGATVLIEKDITLVNIAVLRVAVVLVGGVWVTNKAIRGFQRSTLDVCFSALWRPGLASCVMAAGLVYMPASTDPGLALLQKVIIGLLMYVFSDLALWRLKRPEKSAESYILENAAAVIWRPIRRKAHDFFG